MAAQTYPVAVIAKLLDLTPQRVQQLVKEGIIPREEKGRYELVPCVRGYIRYLRDRAIGVDALPDEAARASRARLIKAQAEAQEMENARTRNELIPRGVVEEELGKVFVAFRSRINSVDTKAPPRMIGCNSLPEMQKILQEMHEEALRELSQYDFKRGGTGNSKEVDQAIASPGSSSSEVNDQPVGRRRKAPIV
jgi:phage terminase Nu1 subunit (DNA packaging protein)